MNEQRGPNGQIGFHVGVHGQQFGDAGLEHAFSTTTQQMGTTAKTNEAEAWLYVTGSDGRLVEARGTAEQRMNGKYYVAFIHGSEDGDWLCGLCDLIDVIMPTKLHCQTHFTEAHVRKQTKEGLVFYCEPCRLNHCVRS